MNNSAPQGMPPGPPTWHNNNGVNNNYPFTQYPGYNGPFQGPPPPGPPPPQGWGGYPPGPGGYGNFQGYQAPWGYTVPPGMPGPPMNTPPNTSSNTPTTDTNKSTNSSENKTKENSGGSKNNPPLPPGPPPIISPVPPPPPPAENEEGEKRETGGTGANSGSNSSKSNKTPSKDSQNHNQNQDQMQGYGQQGFNNFNPMYQGFNQSFEGFNNYGPGGWYNGPPPPNFSKPPPGVPPPGVPPPGCPVPPPGQGPIKFNLPNKKGLGYNAFQHGVPPQMNTPPPPQQHQQNQNQQRQQQNPNQQPQRQNQQQQRQNQRKQQNQHQNQQFTPNNKKKNKDKQNNSMMNQNQWRQFMNQQQHNEPPLPQQSQQQDMNKGGKGGGLIGNISANIERERSEIRDEKKIMKDCKKMSGLVATGDWPESLKVYVGRCFSRCQTELDKDQVEICLKGKLTQAANNGTLWSKNWEEEPLPSIHSQAAVTFLSSMNSLKSWGQSGSANEGSDGSSSPTKTPTSPRNTMRFKKGGMSFGFMKGGRSVRSRSSSSSRSGSRSRSRSRSRSPAMRRGGRRGGGVGGSGFRRRHSSESDEESRGFIRLKGKRDRSPIAARGKMNKKMKGRFKADSHFYSEHGVMKLDPDFSTNERLQKRAARFNPPAARPTNQRTPNTPQNFQQRKKKFGIKKTINNTGLKPVTSMFTVDGDDIDWSKLHVVGTCTTLEKQYLRLTTAPDPSTVRTVPTLTKALEHIKRQWVKVQDYRYACDQLKSLRQDLTIQGIRDSFTVQVYETHSRIALEKGDHEEFNQCQSQLKQLYAEVGGDHKLEFLAYRLLYYIFTKNTLDITSLMAGLSATEKTDECVGFALKLRAAWALGNFHRFFRLYRSAPKMAAYLVDWFADRERKQAMRTIMKGFCQQQQPPSLTDSYKNHQSCLSHKCKYIQINTRPLETKKGCSSSTMFVDFDTSSSHFRNFLDHLQASSSPVMGF